MAETLFRHLEGEFGIEDGTAPLGGDNSTSGKGFAIADTVHFKQNWHCGIPGAQEVGVLGVNHAIPGHCILCRAHRLGKYLAAKDPPVAGFRGLPAVDIHIDLFQIQGVQKLCQGFAHSF